MVTVPLRAGPSGPLASTESPLSSLVIVAPGSTVAHPDGSDEAPYPTLQAAWNAKRAAFLAAGFGTIQLCPGDAGPLALGALTAFVQLSILGVAASGPFSGCTVGAITAAEGTVRSFVCLSTLTAASIDAAATIGSGLTFQLNDVEIDGAIDLADGVLFSENSSPGGSVVAGQCYIRAGGNATTMPKQITCGAFQCDAASEHALLTGALQLGTGQLTPGFTFSSIETSQPSGVVLADADGSTADPSRLIVQPKFITANRTYTVTHANGAPAGCMVDVWTSDHDVTIEDGAAATIATVPAGSPPVRLQLFAATGGGEYALSGMWSLAQ